MNLKEYMRSKLKTRRHEYFQQLSTTARAELEQQYSKRFFSLPIFAPPPRTIGCYYAIKEEVPTSRLIAELWQRGFKVALPHAHTNFTMSFHAYHQGDELELSFGNIPQPSLAAKRLDPDIIIVPMLGFNRDGHRIGYGLGYYDRALQAIRSKGSPVAIGFAFDCQEVSDLFAEEWDEELDWIITESEVFQGTG
jgi:5-formyltetrahydrofolate cyclo-ligase